MNEINFHLENLAWSILLFVIFLVIRKALYRGIESFGRRNSLSLERIMRAKRFMTFFMGISIFSIFLLIWGVQLKEFFLIMATTFTIIGTACFASWSNLSNISSGIILFFSYDLKHGDRIRLGSGDNKIEGMVNEMKLFYVEIITTEDELVIYPNNMMLHQSITILKN